MSDQEDTRLDLIQRDIDGELSAGAKAELARLLLQDPEARRLHEDLKRTDALLRAVPPAEPPAGLRPAILAALGLDSIRRDGTSSSSARWGRYRLAAAILGGLVVVGLGYRLVSTQEDLDGLQGSIAAGAVDQSPADEVVLAVGGGNVTARLYREGSLTRLTVEYTGLEPVEVLVQFDPAPAASQGGATTAPGPDSGRFSVILRAADNRESFEFAGSGAVRLEVRAGGQRLDTVVLGSGE